MFEANGADNLVMIETSSLVPLTQDAVWPSVAPAKYRIVGLLLEDGDLIAVERHLTIEPGAVFELAGRSGILLDGGMSGLKAIGTEAQPIVFQGISGASWRGITLDETTWAENRLERSEIRNASDTNGHSSTTAIYMRYWQPAAVPLTLKDVTFAGPNSGTYDIMKMPGCKLTLEGTNVGTGAGKALAIEDL